MKSLGVPSVWVAADHYAAGHCACAVEKSSPRHQRRNEAARRGRVNIFWAFGVLPPGLAANIGFWSEDTRVLLWRRVNVNVEILFPRALAFIKPCSAAQAVSSKEWSQASFKVTSGLFNRGGFLCASLVLGLKNRRISLRAHSDLRTLKPAIARSL